MEQGTFSYYPPATQADALWGLTIGSVGRFRLSKAEAAQEHAGRKRGGVINEYRIVYISRGSGTFKAKSTATFNVGSGDVVVIFPGEWHHFTRDNSSDWEEMWVGFSGLIVENLVDNKLLKPNAPRYPIGINEDLADMFTRIAEIASTEFPSQQVMSGMVMVILGIIHSFGRVKRPLIKEVDLRLDKAKAIIRENIDGRIDIEKLAQSVNLSYSWFRRAFKENTGVSPARYINRLKLRKAKILLSSSDRSIKDIAISLSFESVEYFSTFFRKMTGKTPLEYRNGSLRR